MLMCLFVIKTTISDDDVIIMINSIMLFGVSVPWRLSYADGSVRKRNRLNTLKVRLFLSNAEVGC